MPVYTFRCHTVGSTKRAYFEEKHADDNAAIQRGLELSKGEGKPAPIVYHGNVELVPSKPTLWYKVHIAHEGRVIGRWGFYGEQDLMSLPE